MKLQKTIRNRYFFVMDMLLVFILYAVVIALVYPVQLFPAMLAEGIQLILITDALYIAAMLVVRAYYIDIVNAGAYDYARIFIGCVLAAVLSIVIGLNIPAKAAIFPKLNIVANMAVIGLICSLRLAAMIVFKIVREYSREKGKKLLIIGAGSLASLLLNDIESNPALDYNVVGLIDDDPKKRRLIIHGAKVIGTRDDIEKICRGNKVDEIIFAIYTLKASDKKELLDICSRTGKKVKILPGLEAFLSGAGGISGMRDVAIEDLLGRDPIELDNKLIGNDLMGKVVLVTGGGGSIGSELCRQIIKYKPERLIILDIYENTTYELQNELVKQYPHQKLDVLIASVRDKDRLNSIFEEYKPEIIFHAAAHKHVPLMEDSPGEAIKNNVFGTYNLAECASEYNAKRFVMISTDKAVNPTNIMGASKRMCEMIVQTFQKTCKTEFVAVRFGNVLGSNGSVVPRFKKQIEDGGPVTVTHPEITRYFMTIPEAAQLVLQAASYAKGGEIFVLDMGEPVKIYELAKKMISLAGLRPNVDIKIEFTGLRPGEKLYEELLMGEEGLQKTAHSKIFIGKPGDLTPEELTEKLKLLKAALAEGNEAISAAVKSAVPTYVVPKIES